MSLFREFDRMQRQMDRMMHDMTSVFSGFDEDWRDVPLLTNQQTIQQQQQQPQARTHPSKQAEESKEQPQPSQQETQPSQQGQTQQQQQQRLQQQLATRGGGQITPFGQGGATQWLSIPAVDILAQGDKYIVKADLPAGVPKENIKLDLDTNRGVLTLSGQHSQEKEEKDESANWVRRERSSGSFTRSLRLPRDVDIKEGGKDLAAKFNNGVLELALPRKQQADPKSQEHRRQSIKIE